MFLQNFLSSTFLSPSLAYTRGIFHGFSSILADHGMAYGLHHGLHLPSHGGEAGAESTLAADLPSLRRSMRLTGQRRQLCQTPRPGSPATVTHLGHLVIWCPVFEHVQDNIRQLNYTDLV